MRLIFSVCSWHEWYSVVKIYVLIHRSNDCTRRYRRDYRAIRAFRRKAVHLQNISGYLSGNVPKFSTRYVKMANGRHAFDGIVIRRQLGYHYIDMSRLIRKHRLTNDINDLLRSGRLRVLSGWENRALVWLLQRHTFSTSTRLKTKWPSLNTLQLRLRAAGLGKLNALCWKNKTKESACGVV